MTLIVSLSSFAQQQEYNFTLSGNLYNLQKGSAIMCIAPEYQVWVDSVSIVNGKFLLKCNLESPRMAVIFIKDTLGNITHLRSIFVGPGNIRAEFDKDRGRVLNIINSPIFQEYTECQTYINSLTAYKEKIKLSQEINKLYLEGDKKNVNILNEKKNTFTRVIIDSVIAWKSDYLNNDAIIYHVFEEANSLPISDQEIILKKFENNKTNSYYLQQLKVNIDNAKKVKQGCIAPNFKVKDLYGKEYTLDSFKGKYVFLEFSASWCGWCKKEIPFIRAAYEKLKEHIVFITMNMDTVKGKWAAEVQGEKIEWLCLSDLQGMKSELAKQYNIHGIPACFVINPKGVIIKQDIRGNEVVEYLSSLF